MKPCRECEHEVSEQAMSCPNCGAPFPAKEDWDGYGFEYKSAASLAGWPLLHISFKYSPKRRPVPAKGIIAIGQFAFGFVTIGQFSMGCFSLSQLTIAVYALAQIGIAYSLIAQVGLYVDQGYGQLVKSFSELLGLG